MKNSCVVGVMAAAALLALPAPADDGDIYQRIRDTEKNIRDSSAQKTDLEKESRDIQEKIKTIVKKEKGYMSLREQTERELLKMKHDIGAVSGEVEHIEKDIVKTEYEIGEMNVLLHRRETALRNRVVALYKMGKSGYVEILLSSGNMLDFENRLKCLLLIARADAALVKNIALTRSQKENYKRQQAKSFDQLNLELNKKIQSEGRIKSKSKQLQELLGQVKKNQKLLEIRNREVQESLANLSRAIEQLMQKRHRLDAEEAALKKQFVGRQGTMRWPVDQNRIIGYQFHPYGSQGVRITLPEGNNVYAVSDGTVVYADWMKGFGKLILLDHGGGYYTVYGHLSGIAASLDAEVKAGAVIATSGETGSDDGAQLYFEIKYNGKSVDVKNWLK